MSEIVQAVLAALAPVLALMGVLVGGWLSRRGEVLHELLRAKRELYARWLNHTANITILFTKWDPDLETLLKERRQWLNDYEEIRSELDLLSAKEVRKLVSKWEEPTMRGIAKAQEGQDWGKDFGTAVNERQDVLTAMRKDVRADL